MYKKESNLIINYLQIISYYYGENNMKSSVNSKIIILIALGILFAFSPIITSNFIFNAGNNKTSSEYDDDITIDYENLKISATSGKIHIDGNSGWVAFKNAGKCTGEGTYSDPYIIEDLVINSEGWGSCILIENSDVYFKIENCFVYSSGGVYREPVETYTGIELSNVNNALIISNNCSSNVVGIFLAYSDNNTISGNIAYNNNRYGIYLSYSNKNTISGNIMNKCGLGLYGSDIKELSSHNIDTTNLVNGKPLYYYSNEVNLEPNNFTNAGQVILANCTDSLISNVNISYCTTGISLFYCNTNTISGNTVNSNSHYGIYLSYSDYNSISGNTANNNFNGIDLYYSDYNSISGNILIGNGDCIWERECQGNEFSDNGSCTYGQADDIIPGYNLFFLLGILSVIAIILSKKVKKS